MGLIIRYWPKSFCRRISKVLALIIPDDQVGFVKNRSIFDSICNILDVVDFHDAYNKEAYLFLIDLRKAYDTLDRSFLFRTLSHFGFPETFVRTVRLLPENSHMQLYINGLFGPHIPLRSGVRQGCPLAPQLFICAIEMFHRYA